MSIITNLSASRPHRTQTSRSVSIVSNVYLNPKDKNTKAAKSKLPSVQPPVLFRKLLIHDKEFAENVKGPARVIASHLQKAKALRTKNKRVDCVGYLSYFP